MKSRLIVALAALIVLLAGSVFGSFGDELDNLVGGKIIAQGGVLYRDYWSHHMPLIYQVSAVLYNSGARSYADFRILWALLLWVFGMVLCHWLKDGTVMLLAFAVFVPVLQLNMVLAENLVGIGAIAAWLILKRRRPVAPYLLILIAWAMTVASLKHVYLAVWITGLTFWQYRSRIYPALIPPAVLTALYLLVYQNGALLIQQAYTFNATIYPPFAAYPGEPVPASPLDALALTVWNYVRAQVTLPGSLHIPFAALSWVTLVVLAGLVRRRRRFDILTLAGILVLTYPINEPRYTGGSHFIAHYAVLFGVSVYAVNYAGAAGAVSAGIVQVAGRTRRHTAEVCCVDSVVDPCR